MVKRRYIYDTETTNISFIQTAVDLKRLGIKNNMFFLALYDPSLRGVDPYSPYLSNDQIIRIVNECIVNPWYFLREVARIPDQGNPKGVPYQLNRANLAATWCFLNGIDHYLVIPRQIGKTQSTVAIINWTFLLGTTDSEIMFINMLADKAIENLSRLKDQRDLLPKYLQFKIAYDEEGNEIKATDNVKTLKNGSNNNSIVTKSSARSLVQAEKIGRGATQPIQYYDEFEFIDFVKTIMEASGPAYNTASENAKRNNAMYCRVFTSTPGDLDSQSGQDALAVVENTCKWTEHFYDKPIEDVKEYIEINSGNNIVYIEYSYTQLGKDDVWFNKVCSLLNNNPLKIKREIFLQRLRGSSQSPYEPEDLARIEELKGQIKEEIFINKLFKLDIYEPLRKDKCYFIGVDVANGYGEDNSAVTIFDPYTIQPAAEFMSANIGVKDLIKFLYVLVRKHLPRSILAIERNANGEAVLDHLRDTDIRGNIYFDNSKDMVGSNIDDKLDAQGMLVREAKRRKLYGIYTQGKSRELMFSLLEGHIKDYKDKFITNNIINDLMKLVRTKTGKIAAGPGFHDDSIMSYLMCLYLYYYGNNLHRFGFVRGQLPDEDNRNKGMTYDQMEDYLSENDKEFFKGVNFTSLDEINVIDNVKQLIEDKRGLVTHEELDMASGKKKTNNIPQPRKLDEYELKIRNEMAKAQRESDLFNRNIKFVSSSENMDLDMDETLDDMPLDLFDELNE